MVGGSIMMRPERSAASASPGVDHSASISLPGDVGRLMIRWHCRDEEPGVIAAGLDLRSDPVRPGMKIRLGQDDTGFFGCLPERTAIDGIAARRKRRLGQRDRQERPPWRVQRAFARGGATR